MRQLLESFNDAHVRINMLSLLCGRGSHALASNERVPPSPGPQDISPQVHPGSTRLSKKPVRGTVLPFSTFSALLFLAAGTGMVFYFRYEKQRVERQRIAEAAKGMGKPKVGGKFELVDHDGKPFSSAEGMGGKFSLVYFGFTHCPDICPEELDKMAQMIDIARAALPPTPSTTPPLLPIFITCDPARDTPAVLKSYLKEFHESIVGLTGTWEQIKAVCKAYRVYFSTPEGVKPGMNYLVDHNPEGDFVEAIGRQHSAEKAAKIIVEHMGDWKGRVIKKP
ncbi:Cu-binding protein [Lignoscripta atroalba]|nr:Cu-binding protein [Lignoscripta atroalba]